MIRPAIPAVLFGLLVCWSAVEVRANVIFVDNLRGDDQYDGTAAEPISQFIGPVRTFRRAAKVARSGDEIRIVNTGRIYYGSLALMGQRHSGVLTSPFRVTGEGVILSGAKPIEQEQWTQWAFDLYRFTPPRKGWYQLIRNGEALPEYDPSDDPQLRQMPGGSWAEREGHIFYRAGDEIAPLIGMAIASEGEGLIITGAKNIIVEGITFQHFRVDGATVHQLAQNVVFVNCTFRENGRSGVSVIGGGNAILDRCTFENNRNHSLLLVGPVEVNVNETEFPQKPTFRKIPRQP